MVDSGTDSIGSAARERALVSRAQGGDEAAFGELFNTHKRRIYSLCLRMAGSTADAEDLTQETFLRVFRKIGSFRGQSTFYTWLHRLAINQVLMHLRLHRKHLQLISLDEVDTSPEQPPMRREYSQDDLHLTGALDRITLSRAVAKLPRGCRTVFLLHDVQGYEHREVARIMQLSVGNSKSQLHKARRSLRARLRRNNREPRRTVRTSADRPIAFQAGRIGE